MSPRVRNPSRVRTPAPSRYMSDYGFDPYPPRKKVTRKRIVNYREPGSDSDDDVIYVGQRTIPRTQLTAPTPTLPEIALGEEDPFVAPKIKLTEEVPAVELAVEEQLPVEVVTGYHGRGLLQTLPCEVCLLTFRKHSYSFLSNNTCDDGLVYSILAHVSPADISSSIQIHQNIAGFFERDSDVLTYAQLCKKTRDSISSSVWRKRFVDTFDMPEGDFETLALAQKYAYRREFAGWVCFDMKPFSAFATAECAAVQEVNTKKCLLVLRDLILESNARKVIDAEGKQTIVGRNHEYIRDWVQHGGRKYTDIIDAILSTDKTSWDFRDVVSATTVDSLVLVIQLCLTYISLHPGSCNNEVSHFDMSQREAYADHAKQPVFVGGWKQDINVRWLLHTVNFFKLHLKSPHGAGVLAQHYEDLEHHQTPQPWLGRIQGGTQPIGSHWKSAYTFLKDHKTLMSLRLNDYDDEPAVDDGETLSDLTIFFDDSKFSSDSWPKAFETLLQTDPYANSSPLRARRTRTSNTVTNQKYELKAFYGTSRGTKGAHFYGRIHGLPPQQDIIGFQRISMIKFYPLNEEYDPFQIWAYEGCVLPGGRVIVGRWWDLTADPSHPVDIFGGPFIWWNVDSSTAAPPISSEEALEFLDLIHDPNIGFA
ncbi:hypothetical protein D0Z07_3720 [Hyphodiscus hymeniophilus]|uniref:Uncharacterized protein n=1 Tax=Hyphodiscus hymeniophilus TaxID=353542 RepID=A0A9P6VL55_9HELO|nr:hypothetical protein D0Z07_3720 [Hyphodiscus hymeniophilus]